MNKSNAKTLILLNILLMFFSLSSVCSKKAAEAQFLSIEFCLYYGLVILLLGIYAIAWQQIIKRLPLTMAYANKAVTVVWGLVWGAVFFGEAITPMKIFGALLVISGVVLYACSDERSETDE